MKIPRINPQKLIRFIESIGFKLIRQSGSHKIYKKEHILITIPYHSNKIIHPKIIKQILKDIQMDLKEFVKKIKIF